MRSRRLQALLILCSLTILLIPHGSVAFAALEIEAKLQSPSVASRLSAADEETVPATTSGQTVENRFNGMRLQLGQAVMLHLNQTEVGSLQYQIELGEISPGLVLRYALLKPQDDPTLPPTELSGGTVETDSLSETLAEVPLGDLLFSLAPMPSVNAEAVMTDGTIPTLTVSLTVSGALEANSDLPPQITAASPAIGTEVFASVGHVEFTVETAPFLPVYFGTSDEPRATDESGSVSQTMLLSTGLLNSLQAYTVGPSGHIALVTRTVLRHWLQTDPAEQVVLRQQPTWRITVPDASLIDLAASAITLDGEPLTLGVDLGQNQVYAAVAAPLPYGTHSLQLVLFQRAADADSEGKMLDVLAWEFELPEQRRAEFQAGKKAISVNAHPLTIDVAPYLDLRTNSTMMPLRLLGDLMGAQVDWRASDQTVIFRTASKTVQVTVGSRTALVNGVTVPLLTAPANINGRTMVPLRFVSESLGAIVNWDPGSGKITVDVTAE